MANYSDHNNRAGTSRFSARRLAPLNCFEGVSPEDAREEDDNAEAEAQSSNNLAQYGDSGGRRSTSHLPPPPVHVEHMWKCCTHSCAQVNHSERILCINCGSRRGSSNEDPEAAQSKISTWSCPTSDCRTMNSHTQAKCLICGTSRFPTVQEKQPSVSSSRVAGPRWSARLNLKEAEDEFPPEVQVADLLLHHKAPPVAEASEPVTSLQVCNLTKPLPATRRLPVDDDSDEEEGEVEDEEEEGTLPDQYKFVARGVDDTILPDVYNTTLQTRIDSELKKCKEWMRRLFRESSQLDDPHHIPKDLSYEENVLLKCFLGHPDVAKALAGKRSFNLLWHVRHTNLVPFLRHVKDHSPQFFDLLLNCVESYNTRAVSTTNIPSLFSFLDSLSQSNPNIWKFQDLSNKKMESYNFFFVYILWIPGYEANFHIGKVYSKSMLEYFRDSTRGSERRQRLVPGYPHSNLNEEDYSADKIQGFVFDVFRGDPLLDRSVDADEEIPAYVRWLATNFAEALTHLILAGPVTMGKRPGHGLYGDCRINLPDEEHYAENFERLRNNFAKVCVERGEKTKDSGWFTDQMYYIRSGSLSAARQNFLEEKGFYKMVLCYKLIRTFKAIIDYSSVTTLAPFLAERHGVLPKFTTERAFRSCFYEAKVASKGTHILKRLLCYALSPQDTPFEQDRTLNSLYEVRACRVRMDPSAVFEKILEELFARCHAYAFHLFQLGPTLASKLDNRGILEGGASTCFDLSTAGKAYFLKFIDELPDGVYSYQQQRLPVTNFYKKEELESAYVSTLEIVLQQEGLKSRKREKKADLVKRILLHQKDRDMRGRDFVPLPRGWTSEEKNALKEGVKKYGVGQWDAIKTEYEELLRNRTLTQIKDVWQTMMKNNEVDREIRRLCY